MRRPRSFHLSFPRSVIKLFGVKLGQWRHTRAVPDVVSRLGGVGVLTVVGYITYEGSCCV